MMLLSVILPSNDCNRRNIITSTKQCCWVSNNCHARFYHSIRFILLLSMSLLMPCHPQHDHFFYTTEENIHQHHDHSELFEQTAAHNDVQDFTEHLHSDQHHHHHHHRKLNEVTGEIEIDACGYIEPSPAEVWKDQVSMLLWSFQRNGNPDAPPVNYTIPTYFHILLVNESFPLITDSNVDLYMSYLANAFSASNAPFRFPLMGITRTINGTWANSCRVFQNDYTKNLRRGGPETLNIYLCNSMPLGPNGGSITGSSSSPTNARGNVNDGVLIVRTNPTDLNRPNTLVHEVGHFLGLLHTFVDNCTTTRGGDLVDDTPYHVSLASRVNCFSSPLTWDTCPLLPGLDPVDNYMTYTTSNHACRTKFTPGQVERMKAQFEIYRYSGPPTSAPTKTPTKQPTKQPTNLPTKTPTKRPTTAPTKSPGVGNSSLTESPVQSETTPKPAPLPSPPTKSLQTRSPTRSPTSAPQTKSPVSRSPTISPRTGSPITRSPSISPRTGTPITESPTISPRIRSPAAPAPIIPIAPVPPKCRFWFSLCNRDQECCSGRCRFFFIRRRCLIG